MRRWQVGARWLAIVAVLLLPTGCSWQSLFGQDPALVKIGQQVGQDVRLVERQSGAFGSVIRYQYGEGETCWSGYLNKDPAGQMLRNVRYSGCEAWSRFDELGYAPAIRDGVPGRYYTGLTTDAAIRRVLLVTADGQRLPGTVKGHAWYVWVPNGAAPPVARKVVAEAANGRVLDRSGYPYPASQGPRTALAVVRWSLDVEPTELLRVQGDFGDLLAFTYHQDGLCGYGHWFDAPDGSGTGYDTDLIPCGGDAALDQVGNGERTGWSLAYGRVHHPGITAVRVRLSDRTEVAAQLRDGAWAAEWSGPQEVQALIGLGAQGEVVWQGAPVFILNAAAQSAQAGKRP